MIWDIISGLFGGLWGYVATAGAAVVGAALLWLGGGRAARNKGIADAAKRSEAGRKAATRARDKIAGGESPEELARKNDGKW